eukprot:Phypoly_transcript_00154.p1 GENE.Phypoly_transcript_00154~~Phypoly_transcript_00154.p1  ORF type:complete len:2133 (+),score=340.58 Phypoly_transcript_00154:537-6401(+)
MATGDPPLTYLWSRFDPSAMVYALVPGNESTLSGIPAGSYSLQVNSGVCLGLFYYNVTQPDAINITTTLVAPSCASTGTISYSVTGGSPDYTVTLKPSSGSPVNVTGGFIENLAQDFYTLTATDSHMCVQSVSAPLVLPSNISIQADAQNITCPGANDGHLYIFASLGVPPYRYFWEHDSNLTASNLTNLGPGTYRVVVRDSSAACSVAQAIFTLTAPPAFNATFNLTAPSVTGGSDGSIVANVTGGTPPYIFTWNSGTGRAETVTGPAKMYTLLVADAVGCSFSWTVAIPAAICGDNKITGTEQCDPPGVGCCDATCNFVTSSAKFVCRSAASQCDVAELCPGDSAKCPVDSLVPNNSPCSLNCSTTATCQTGVCTNSKSFDCTGGYCNSTLNECRCTNTSMGYPYCVTSCPALSYGPNCQYNCTCYQGSCFDGPHGNGSCSCNNDWFGANCSVTIPPVFTQAKFAADGLTFLVTFDIDTTYGGQTPNVAFPCSNLLAPSTMAYLDPSSSCTWLSRKTLSVAISGNTVIRVGTLVALKNNSIFAYPASVAASNGTQLLLAPDNATVPTLSLTGPSLVGSCDGITISAIVQGTFSVPTVNVWSVTSTTTNLTAVAAFLSNYTQLLPTIPDSLLVSGNTYNFTLSVTNLFNTTATSTLTIKKSLYNVPTISIPGAAVLSVTAPTPLTLQGSVVVATDAACQPAGALVWGWTVVRYDTQEIVPLAANVVNKKSLVIPGGTLSPGANYTVTVMGSYPSLPGNLSNSASMTIIVQRSDLVSAIAGGNIRSSSISQPLVVNATNSFDPDNSNLTYTWSCTANGGPCEDNSGGSLVLPHAAALVFPANTLSSNLTYQFLLVVSTPDGRTTNTSVNISVVTGMPPSVSISKIDSPIVGSSQSLALNGVVSPMANTTFLWTETTGQLDLDNRANLLTSRTNINLVIKPNVLQPGAKYTFVLQATNSNGTGIAGVDIAVSPLPHGGICGVVPSSGTPVITSFVVSCSGWEDISTLTYTFSYMLSGTEVILRTQVAESLSTPLPLPSGSSDVPIIVKITNKYNATATTTFNATVILQSDGTGSNNAFVAQAFDQITANLDTYGDPDASIQSLVALSSVLQASPGGSSASSAQAVVLSQKIFTLFAGVATNLTSSSASVEQQAGNVAILSQSSANWDASSKGLLANVIFDYSNASSSASPQALGGLLTGLSNIFGTDSAPVSSGDNSTDSRRRSTRGMFRRDAAQNSSLGNDTALYTKLRASVGHITNSVLGSMVCGQDDTNIGTSNIQLTAGKVPRENLQNASFNVNGMSTKFPFNSSSFGDDIDCMDTKIALQPIDLYHDSSDYFVSHVATVTVGAGGSDFDIHNLSQPIEMVFPVYNYTTPCNATSNCSQTCQFLNETSNQWQSDGCKVFSSNLTHVVCHCDHLTSFSVQFKDSLQPLKDAGRLIAHPSFASLKDRPAPIIFIACIFAVYIGAMGAAIWYDRKRGFYDTDIPLPDEAPPMYSEKSEKYSPTAQPATLNPEIVVTMDGEESETPTPDSPVPNRSHTTLRVTDGELDDSSELSHSSDLMMNGGGSLRSNSNSPASSLGRKMGRRSMRGSIRRKSLLMKDEQEKEKLKEKAQLNADKKMLSGKDFSASLDAVDKVYGVSDQVEPVQLTKWQEFRLDVSLRIKTNHRYFRIFFRKSGDPFSRARRVTVLLNVVITCMACNAIFYNTKHTDEHIPIGEKILIAFWSSLLITPVNLAVYFMLSKAGFRYPPMEDVELDDFGNPIPRETSIAAPDPFKPSRLLRREQQELERIKAKYEQLCERVFNMGIEQAVKIGRVGRERLMELVALSRAQLEYVASKVQKRHDQEYYVYEHPPPPGRFSKIKATLMGEWPWWWSIIGYTFSFLVTVFSVYICLIYAANFTRSAMNGWLVSSAIAIAQDLILNQPLASVGGAIFGIFLGTVVNKMISSLGGLIKGAS